MDDEDLTPRHAAPKPVSKELAVMSIEALKDYIAELEAEITRARETIAEKEGSRSEAESLFKS